MSGSTAWTPPSFAPMSTRPFWTSRRSTTAATASSDESQQPGRVVEEQLAGIRQRAVPRGSVDQTLAAAVLEPADGLADGRLGPASFRAAREKLRSAATAEYTILRHPQICSAASINK